MNFNSQNILKVSFNTSALAERGTISIKKGDLLIFLYYIEYYQDTVLKAIHVRTNQEILIYSRTIEVLF